MHFTKLLSIVALATISLAHPGEEHGYISSGELARRELEATARHLQARKCSSAIAEFQMQRRMAREGFMKRETATTPASDSHIATIRNSTCITAPEVIEGPYYINNEYIRTDLRETQRGVSLTLDVGVIDTTTCKPLNNVFVELWAANATGVYGGYNTYGAPTTVHKETFLRGGYYTNPNGIVEITTIYPGFYEGRTAHIHAMVHKNWAKNANGTLISHSGNLVHIGQFFFAESWNDKVYATSPYTLNHQGRTLNSQDGILQQANSGGNNAFISLQPLGNTLSEGLLGYITVGVDSRKSYTIYNKNTL